MPVCDVEMWRNYVFIFEMYWYILNGGNKDQLYDKSINVWIKKDINVKLLQDMHILNSPIFLWKLYFCFLY